MTLERRSPWLSTSGGVSVSPDPKYSQIEAPRKRQRRSQTTATAPAMSRTRGLVGFEPGPPPFDMGVRDVVRRPPHHSGLVVRQLERQGAYHASLPGSRGRDRPRHQGPGSGDTGADGSRTSCLGATGKPWSRLASGRLAPLSLAKSDARPAAEHRCPSRELLEAPLAGFFSRPSPLCL